MLKHWGGQHAAPPGCQGEHSWVSVRSGPVVMQCWIPSCSSCCQRTEMELDPRTQQLRGVQSCTCSVRVENLMSGVLDRPGPTPPTSCPQLFVCLRLDGC